MRRGRHEFRLTVWTFVAPIALVVAVLVVVNIAQQVLSDRSSVQATLAEAGARPQANDGPGTTTAGQGGQRRKFYVVKAGDTLSQIATRFNISEVRLQELNPSVDALSLKPGQRIRVG
jgi:LysM repeat protein